MSYALPSVKVGPPDFQTLDEAREWCAALFAHLVSDGFFIRKEAQEQRDRQLKTENLDALSSVDDDADYVPVYDASAGAPKKALVKDLLATGQTYTVTNGSTDRAFDADAAGTDTELRDVVYTLLGDLAAKGVVTLA